MAGRQVLALLIEVRILGGQPTDLMRAVLLLLALAVASITAAQQSFSTTGDRFRLDGKPFQIRSGEMHYSRVPRPYWRDRLRKMKAMGLNTVGTYMFWNVHEPEPGEFHFAGNDDVAAFVKDAQAEGMYVLLRPGPYACAEWEWGGYPYWLANIPDLKVRSRDPRFLVACGRYLEAIARQLAPLQITKGGPILLVQVENEYGSYGNDKIYLEFIRDTLRKSGFDCPLYTVDGPSESMITGGTLPDVFAAINFGSGAEGAFKELAKYRTGQPLMCGEFYPGWFDQWGRGHSLVPLGDLKDFEWMMSRGISFSMYMVHGGWTPGFMNGANVDNGDYHPQTNSYYDDTCIDDAGRLTTKFEAYRKIIGKYLPTNEQPPDPPKLQSTIGISRIEFKECSPLLDNLPDPVVSARPMSFEELKQPYGFVLYRHALAPGTGTLELKNLQDRAVLFREGVVLDRRLHRSSSVLSVVSGQLDILVENLGRVNYGKEIVAERKGFSSATWDAKEILGKWLHYRFPMRDLKGLKFSKKMKAGPAWYRATFNLSNVGDTFLDIRKWNKGVVWVNGHNLGRYWRIGSQQTTYVPGCWLKKGRNEIVLFELGDVLDKTLTGVTDPVWEDVKE
jgi:beta-galactosidase